MMLYWTDGDRILTDLAKLKKLFVSPVTILDDPAQEQRETFQLQSALENTFFVETQKWDQSLD